MTSKVPETLAAIVSALTSAAATDGHVLHGVQVVDGQPVDELEADVLVIGWSPDRVAVQVDRTTAGLQAEREAYDVACLASSWRGDRDPAPVRTRAFALLDAVSTVLAADPGLGDLVLDTRVSFNDLDQQQTPDGPTATVAFTVRVSAFA